MYETNIFTRLQDLQAKRFSWWQYKPQREDLGNILRRNSLNFHEDGDPKPRSRVLTGPRLYSRQTSLNQIHMVVRCQPIYGVIFVYFCSPVWLSLPPDVTWNAPWTSLTTTTSTDAGSSWPRRGGGEEEEGESRDRGQGAEVGAGAGGQFHLSSWIVKVLFLKIRLGNLTNF